MTELPTLSNVHVVLVRPIYSRNVGSVSRAMANIGAGRLILIDAKCEYNLEARQGAAGAQTRLMEATRHNTWDDFYTKETDGIRIAFCGIKKSETDGIGFESRLQEYINEISPARPLYLIFGPEDYGLTNDDCQFAHYIHQLPARGDYSSLNISHAVLLALYIADRTYTSHVAQNPEVTPTTISPASLDDSNRSKFYFPEQPIKAWLDAIRMDVGNRRTDAYLVLKRYLLKQRPTAKELRILEAIINQTVRKLKEVAPKN